MVGELVIAIDPVPADQAVADRAAIVVDDVRADVGLRTARGLLAIEVNQPVIAINKLTVGLTPPDHRTA